MFDFLNEIEGMHFQLNGVPTILILGILLQSLIENTTRNNSDFGINVNAFDVEDFG